MSIDNKNSFLSRIACIRYSLILLCFLVSFEVSAQEEDLDPSGLHFAAKIGFSGDSSIRVGAEIGWDIISYSRVRIAGGYGTNSIKIDNGNALLGGGSSVRRSSPWVAVFADTYPFQKELLGDSFKFLNNFRITVGLGWYGDNASVKKDLRPGDQFSPSNRNITVQSNGLEIDTVISNGWPVSPYVGIGFETNRQKGFVFGAEIGAVFLGKPKVDYTLNWYNDQPTNSADNDAIAQEAKDLAEAASKVWKWWNLDIAFNIGWHF